MKKSSTRSEKIKYEIHSAGTDILSSKGMETEKKCIQHGDTTVFTHSFNVAYYSLRIAAFLHITVDRRSLIRGALLHDYFLYDWHGGRKNTRPHGFIHAKIALNNALKEFKLNDIEKDIISKHMFPLNIRPPKYKESIIVCLADKICASWEILKMKRLIIQVQ